jgi:SAM-dependent methyltransferase
MGKPGLSGQKGSLADSGNSLLVPPNHRRYLSGQPRRTEAYLQAAQTYVSRLSEGEMLSLYQKPFDRNPGNRSFYLSLYQVLNLLQAMQVPCGGRIVEVGSGPGWLTELLMGLGFEVDAVEPSAAMVRVAQDRLASSLQHYRIPQPPRVAFHVQSFEECPLPDGCADAILFHESFHHLIDEDRALTQCQRLLGPGGVLGISGDSNWQPGNRSQASLWEEEMDRFGTLENPCTWEYLHYLLRQHGFVEITRYHGVNGLFPIEEEQRTIRDVAQFRAEELNTVTARKPETAPASRPTTQNGDALTRGEIRLLSVQGPDPRQKVRLRVKLVNCGETTWLAEARKGGWVTLALVQGKSGGPYLQEAHPRQMLPQALAPGQALEMEAVYHLPDGYRSQPWHLELVNEMRFWFSSRGTAPAEVKFPT